MVQQPPEPTQCPMIYWWITLEKYYYFLLLDQLLDVKKLLQTQRLQEDYKAML